MAIIDNGVTNTFRLRIAKSCNALENVNEAEEVIRLCMIIENSAKALRRMAKEEIDNEEPQE